MNVRNALNILLKDEDYDYIASQLRDIISHDLNPNSISELYSLLCIFDKEGYYALSIVRKTLNISATLFYDVYSTEKEQGLFEELDGFDCIKMTTEIFLKLNPEINTKEIEEHLNVLISIQIIDNQYGLEQLDPTSKLVEYFKSMPNQNNVVKSDYLEIRNKDIKLPVIGRKL